MRISWRPVARYLAWVIGFPIILYGLFRLGVGIGYSVLGKQSFAAGLTTEPITHIWNLIFG